MVRTSAADFGRPDDDLPDRPFVHTIAGSGALGTSDGPEATASFVAPAAISYDKEGNLFIADRDGQRIRKLSSSGNVSTVAGSGALLPFGFGVPGGFADGPADKAQFNMPEGILALSDGSILVADTKNYCIRRISGAVVSTFSGDHTNFAGRDGSLEEARFTAPRSLAQTADGTVVVADPPNGVRVIKHGVVTTLHFSDSRAVVAVASIPSKNHLIVAATATSIDTIDIDADKATTSVPLESGFVHVAAREGGRPYGPPSAVAAFAADEIISTDPLQGAIRMVQIDLAIGNNYTRVLTETPSENGPFGGGGFMDGPGDNARVNEPMGIAISPTGSIAIADTGNRRIRLMAPFNRHTHVTTELAKNEIPSNPNPKEYRIAIVGNSYTWFDQAWHESIGGEIQDDLRTSHVTSRRVATVYPIMRLGLPSLGALSLIDNELSDGSVDMVVLDLSTYGQIFSIADVQQQFGPGWEAALTKGLSSTSKALHEAHVAFIVVNQPGAADFPDDFAYRRMPKGLPEQHGDSVERRDPSLIEAFHDQTTAAIAESGAPLLDLFPAFSAAYGAEVRQPLFEAWDHHLAPAGRLIVASAIASEIERQFNEAATLQPH